MIYSIWTYQFPKIVDSISEQSSKTEVEGLIPLFFNAQSLQLDAAQKSKNLRS